MHFRGDDAEEEDDETISINPWFYEDEEEQDEQEARQISPFTMAAIVSAYLVLELNCNEKFETFTNSGNWSHCAASVEGWPRIH